MTVEAIETLEVSLIDEDLLRVHGKPPGKKEEGMTRLLYENANSISNILAGNEKVEKTKELIDELEADLVAYNEHRMNLKHKANQNGFNQLFRGGESDICSVAGHNVHENVGRVQEGGTAVMAFGPIIEQMDYDSSQCNALGLGRWTFMRFIGANNRATIFLCGYVPCYNNKTGSMTSYQQHKRYYINQENDLTCPWKRFCEDLLTQLKK